MTRQLRKHIMFIMMLLLSLTFISIIIAINIWLRTGNRVEADNSLRFLLQREIRPDNESMPEENLFNTPKDTEREPPFQKEIIGEKPLKDRRMDIVTSHFILVKYTCDNQIISIDNTLSESYSNNDIEQYCEKILSSSKLHGTIGHLRYAVERNDSDTTIVFIDHTSAVQSDKNLLTISIIAGMIGLAAFAFLSYLISGLMVRPVEEAFDKQKQFISDASHELKTPITVILSNSELLEDQIGQNRQLSYIKKECDQMHHLVTSLLTLARLERIPYEEMEKNSFSLSDALLERILPMESVAFEKGITMQEDISPSISFFGVKEQLQQVAAILIDNALTHTPRNGKIEITLKKTQHHILFTVGNTGEEIPAGEREKLFERFYRSDKARHRASGHFGLGLSIAKTIITNHKGKIQVECKDGITSFIVTLNR